MSVKNRDDRIEKYLDELADEYKELLFQALVTRTKTPESLSVSDLLRIDNQIKKPLLGDYARIQRRQRIFLLGGLTYTIIGFLPFMYYAFREYFNAGPTQIEFLSLPVGFIGLVLCVLSFAYPILMQGKNRISRNTPNELRKATLEYEVITMWRDLEGVVSDLSSNNEAKSPRTATQFLNDNHFIDSDEQDVLRDLLKIRNSIVHTGNIKYDIALTQKVLDKTDTILKKLSALKQ